jgi:diaminohydroxyphosphoribosylaminopyrimidine deaminase/5-amino-6-(5-phosphoribosylamino)uracil reductase
MKLGTRLSRDEAMSMAIEQAKLGAAFVSPNPQVGCVILNAQQELVGFGFHKKFGEAHAEINALKGLTPAQLQGAHIFVTLEPCAHQGKTGSCAKKLIEFPVAQVTYGLQDPFPLVAGKGAGILKLAGIKAQNYSDPVETPDADPDVLRRLQKVCEIFLKNVNEQKMFIGIKLAQSLDGKMSLENGTSKWITSEMSRKYSHYLRAVYDVLVVGGKTVLVDDPSLNVRDQDFQKINTVLILDPAGKTWRNKLKLLETHPKENVFWAVCDEQCKGNLPLLSDQQVIPVKAKDGQLDLYEIHNRLWQKGFRSMLVEGGAQSISRFLQAGLVDRLHLFQAPIVMGGSAPGWAATKIIQNIQTAQALDIDESCRFGPDFYLSGRFLTAKGRT